MNYNDAGNTGWYSQNSDWNYTPPTYGDTESPGGYGAFDWSEYANNPEFLRLIGYEGSPFSSGTYNDSSSQLDPAFLEKANQYEMRKMTGQDWGGSLSGVFKNGKEVSPGLRNFNMYDEGPEFNLGFSLASMA